MEFGWISGFGMWNAKFECRGDTVVYTGGGRFPWGVTKVTAVKAFSEIL